MEARILAEDPRSGWAPGPGPLRVYREPAGEGIRVDSGVAEGDQVNDQFDSMIAKLIVWAPGRAAAAERLSAALARFRILGPATNLPLLQAISRAPDFLAGRVSTGWIQARLEALNAPLLPGPWMALLASQGFREALACALAGTGQARGAAARFQALDHAELSLGVKPGQAPFRLRAEGAGFVLDAPGQGLLELDACRIDGSRLALTALGETLTLEDPLASLAAPAAERGGAGPVLAPMAGKVLEVHVAPGDLVEPGQLLFVVESMKMQFEITAHRRGRVEAVLVAPGQVLQGPEPLALVV